MTLVKENQNEELLSEIYDILKESEEAVTLTNAQLQRLDVAEGQIERGEVKSNKEVLRKHTRR